MLKISAEVVSVHAGASDQVSTDEQQSIIVELDGIVGDRYRSFTRENFVGDKQQKGTVRRNERQWSAVCVHELLEVQESLDLAEPLTAKKLGANLCIKGVPDLSRLPKGTILKFPSGAELCVEEYNPPCLGISTKIADAMKTNSGKPLQNTAFSKSAKFMRGVVGVVEVAGAIKRGDEVEVTLYEQPTWLARD